MADRVAGRARPPLQGIEPSEADDDLVFAHPASGSALDRHDVSRRFKIALKRAGVRRVRFHDLRHTFGTRMAAAGVPIDTLQEWMGHVENQDDPHLRALRPEPERSLDGQRGVFGCGLNHGRSNRMTNSAKVQKTQSRKILLIAMNRIEDGS